MPIVRKPPPDAVRTQSIALTGGLDTQSPRTQMSPGSLVASENYAPSPLGGYERFGDYERFDGRLRPSAADISILGSSTTFGAGIVVGATVVGATSAATGVIAWVMAGAASAQRIALTKSTGTFVAGENLMVSAVASGVASIEPPITQSNYNDAMAGAANIYRADIQQVPGNGPVRGICILGDVVFAFRDGASTQGVYKSTTAGWVAIAARLNVKFSTATGLPPFGSTIEQWNGAVLVATGTINRFMHQSGSLIGGTGAGAITITVVSGTFSSSAYTLKVGGGAVFTATTVSQATITIQNGGRWQFTYHRFTAVDTTAKLTAYGISEIINRDGTSGGGGAFIEIDESGVLSLITGPLSGTNPHCVAVNSDHLFITNNNNIYHSAPGLPYDWTVLSGAGQIAVGSRLVALSTLPGSSATPALLVQSSETTSVLYGTDTLTWQLNNLSEEVGGLPLTAQYLGGPIGLDHQGVRSLTPSQTFANFTSSTLTAHILDRVIGLTPVGSAVDRIGGRYLLFLSGGQILVGSAGQYMKRKMRWQWMWCRLADVPFVVESRELAGNPETMFGGANNGYVYIMGGGRSFDGATIEAWLKTSYANMGTPIILKSFRGFEIEATGDSSGSISVRPDFDSGDVNVGAGRAVSAAIATTGNAWDIGSWDIGAWDSGFATLVKARTGGVGVNASLNIVSRSAVELKHRLNLFHTRFIQRRTVR